MIRSPSLPSLPSRPWFPSTGGWRTPARGALMIGLALASAAGCAAGGSTFGDGSDEGDADGIEGEGAGSGQGGQGPGISGAGGGPADLDQCAVSMQEATQVPVNMIIAVDKSGSMLDGNKWGSAKNAFVSFFQDPAADPLRVALRFWPDDGCDELSCNTAACSKPLVDVGPLSDPAHEQALVGAFASNSPWGYTPMSAALEGAEAWAIAYQAAKQGAEKVVVVLVTDGEPTACNVDIAAIAHSAASAYTAAGILTFAVGLLGSNEAQMHQIAQAGNTDQGFFIGNGNAEADLLAALQAIQHSTVACSYAMPEPDDPSTPIDPTKVNVTFDEQPIAQVGSAAECSAGGWFYDDPSDPASIQLCETTCAAIQGNLEGKLEIVLGCTTILQ